MSAFATHDLSIHDGASLVAEPLSDGESLRESITSKIIAVTGRDTRSPPVPLPPASARAPQDYRFTAYLASYRKRGMDVCMAALLLLLALPVFALVALAIKATSVGPVLFRQRRAGLRGAPFTVLKFRSMSHSPCRSEALIQATSNDPRVTAVGRFLRRTSVDELPQLINVLRGEMSMIGPRPHAVFHDQYYAARIPLYSRRLLVRPGLSGLAQVSGARGETPQLADMERRVSLDCEYMKTASMLGDVRLLMMTAKEMLVSRTAL